MPYVPPHLRAQSYYTETPAAPKIATTLAEAQAMSKAVTKAPKSPTSFLSEMLSKTAPKQAGTVSKKTPQQSAARNKPLGNLHAAKPSIISATSAPVASGSFSGMIPSPAPIQQAVAPKTKPKASKMISHVPDSTKQASTVTTNTPEFDAAMDDILRTLFEEGMSNVKRIATANNDFTRRSSGSYKSERIESRYQGFKLKKLESHAGKAGDVLEAILRSQFQISMQGVKRIASAAPLNFATRTNGAYVNERLESRYQGYRMASLNDFELNVLSKLAENRAKAKR